MKIIQVLLFLTISLMFFGCVSQKYGVQDSKPQDNSQEVQESNIIDEEPIEEVQVANPASVYCEEQEGILEIRTSTDGSQMGYCVFIDDETGEKSECEEWAFYRGTCIIEDEKDIEDDNDEEKGFASELEKDLPNTPSNEICKKIPLTKDLSPGDRHYCFAVVNNNPEFCEFIIADNEDDIEAKNEKNLCLAHANKDISYCKKMSDNEAKHDCYFGLAMISGDINVCEGINYDKNDRELCYWSFANALYWEGKSDKITTTHCNKLPAGSQSRNSCLAEKDKDVSLCKNDVTCLTLFEQPMSFCEGQGKILKYCVRDRAMTSKNISICKTLTGEYWEDCFGDFAGHITQDISTCNQINDIKLKQTCYKDVAIQSGTNFWFNLYN